MHPARVRVPGNRRNRVLGPGTLAVPCIATLRSGRGPNRPDRHAVRIRTASVRNTGNPGVFVALVGFWFCSWSWVGKHSVGAPWLTDNTCDPHGIGPARARPHAIVQKVKAFPSLPSCRDRQSAPLNQRPRVEAQGSTPAAGPRLVVEHGAWTTRHMSPHEQDPAKK